MVKTPPHTKVKMLLEGLGEVSDSEVEMTGCNYPTLENIFPIIFGDGYVLLIMC